MSTTSEFWLDVHSEISRVARMELSTKDAADGDWLRRSQYNRVIDSAVARVARRKGIHRVLVQGQRCRTYKDALRSLGDALELPGYYGQNYDALDECLRELLEIDDGHLGAVFGDRVGRPASGLLVVIDYAENLLAEEPPQELATLMSVLERAAHPLPDPLGRPEPRTGSFDVLLFSRGSERNS
ncbi:hypothetical protein Ae406Ps2_1699c [Pseudonocardia sp. Ae406_Ps2]|uniref:barstar family protein n=1 Tax=unclassified Pseudonocardia TaxID=2619320 RepID=UPI000966E341|nr:MULTISPECIES: barstar family protein [unclassified Pseudonocardia]OLM01699.1 hypothetical protein Ae406Ps2_1699c [Pseudonocardia sp. Ae406_Ps2]OLM06517.1 hypothetical protein Ae331Ps2_4227 [Pseudonocardia sp. Ae331_Ps2]OLM13256.1 hypothetical protein Ae505Ps2_3384 [Pseudonocardia sp. Ae505_Ps2]OLM23270.1 hypothetical protein Ae706Ps2_1703c [Pseudonocardia sp. Ae706_Ps2]